MLFTSGSETMFGHVDVPNLTVPEQSFTLAITFAHTFAYSQFYGHFDWKFDQTDLEHRALCKNIDLKTVMMNFMSLLAKW